MIIQDDEVREFSEGNNRGMKKNDVEVMVVLPTQVVVERLLAT